MFLPQKKASSIYELHPFIEERWSPRSFADRPIEKITIEQLFEAVRWAASSNNYQPWRFIYAHKGSEAYSKILDCLSDFNQKWVGNAPVLTLTAIKEQFDNGKDNYHALHDLGLAMGNLTFQAQSMGIALHHMAGVDWKKSHVAFNVPDGYHVVTGIAMGYYGGDPKVLPSDLQEAETKARERKKRDDILSEGSWSEKF